jgi:hypothetical protein
VHHIIIIMNGGSMYLNGSVRFHHNNRWGHQINPHEIARRPTFLASPGKPTQPGTPPTRLRQKSQVHIIPVGRTHPAAAIIFPAATHTGVSPPNPRPPPAPPPRGPRTRRPPRRVSIRHRVDPVSPLPFSNRRVMDHAWLRGTLWSRNRVDTL